MGLWKSEIMSLVCLDLPAYTCAVGNSDISGALGIYVSIYPLTEFEPPPPRLTSQLPNSTFG